MKAPTVLPGRLPTWTAILTAILHGWLQRGTRPVLALVLLALVALPLGVFWFLDAGAALKMLTALASALLMVAWGGLVYGLIVQNTATAARLVPAHAQRLREVLGLGWCITLALVGGLVMLRGAAPALPLMAVGSVMLAVALAVRWPLLVFVVWAVPAYTTRAVGEVLGSVASLLGAGYGAAMLLGVLLVGWLLGGLIGAGDAGHLARQSRLAAWRRAARTGSTPADGGGFVWSWLSQAFSAPYQSSMDRLSRFPGPSVWPRLMLVFGPTTHWRVHASWAGGLAGLGILGIAWLWFEGVFKSGTLHAGQIAGPAIGLASMALNPVMSLTLACARTRREQALVSLLPGVPRGAALNRGLAWRQVLHFAAAWVLVAALEVGFVALVAPAWLPAVMAGLIGLWPMAGLFFVDLSRLPAQPNARLGLVMFAFLGGALAALGAHLGLGWSTWQIGLASGLLTAGLVVRGWLRLDRLPSALPACRLA